MRQAIKYYLLRLKGRIKIHSRTLLSCWSLVIFTILTVSTGTLCLTETWKDLTMLLEKKLIWNYINNCFNFGLKWLYCTNWCRLKWAQVRFFFFKWTQHIGETILASIPTSLNNIKVKIKCNNKSLIRRAQKWSLCSQQWIWVED